MKVRACIFNLGTIVDRYSLFPIVSLKNTFNKYGITLNNKLIYDNMGMSKLNHIREIIKNPYIKNIWNRRHGNYPGKKEEYILYLDYIFKSVCKYAQSYCSKFLLEYLLAINIPN